jgi:hypothetical protein
MTVRNAGVLHYPVTPPCGHVHTLYSPSAAASARALQAAAKKQKNKRILNCTLVTRYRLDPEALDTATQGPSTTKHAIRAPSGQDL